MNQRNNNTSWVNWSKSPLPSYTMSSSLLFLTSNFHSALQYWSLAAASKKGTKNKMPTKRPKNKH